MTELSKENCEKKMDSKSELNSYMKNIVEIMDRLEEIQRKIGAPQYECSESNLKGKLLELFQKCCPLSRNMSDDDLWNEHLEIKNILNHEFIPKNNNVSDCLKQVNRDIQIENLIDVLSKKGNLSKLKFEIINGNGVLLAQENIDPMTIYASIPVSLIIVADQYAENSTLQRFLLKDPIVSSLQNVLLSYALLLEFYNGSKSKHIDYIKTLPETYNNCLYFETEHFELLKGTTSFRDALNHYKSVVRQYAYFHLKIIQNQEIMKNVEESEEILRLTQNFCFNDYRWAAATIMSKSISLPSVSGQCHALSLIPLIDLCDHCDTITNFEYDPAEEVINISNGFEIAKGDQIKIFLGAKTNSQFVLSHGFFFEDNNQEFFLLRISLKNTPSYQDRHKLLIQAGISEFTGVPIGLISKDVWTGDIVPFMRIYEASDEELGKIKEIPGDSFIQRLNSIEPISESNESNAKNALKKILEARIQFLKSSSEDEDKKLMEENICEKTKNIIKLKRRELFIFESFLSNLENTIK